MRAKYQPPSRRGGWSRYNCECGALAKRVCFCGDIKTTQQQNELSYKTFCQLAKDPEFRVTVYRFPYFRAPVMGGWK
jgi:hypothetical protein